MADNGFPGQDLADSIGRASLAPTPPSAPGDVPAPAPPRWWGHHFAELRWQAELARLLVDPVYRVQGVPRGDGGPVILIPGFLAGDSSLAIMRNWLLAPDKRSGLKRPRWDGAAESGL